MTHIDDDGADESVADDLPESDRALMDALRIALGGEPIPPDLAARCEGLLTWADVDSELAALLEPELELPGTRGADSTATLEFSVANGSCVVEATPSHGVIHGQLLGRVATAVFARTATGGVESGAVTKSGAFEVRVPSAGLVRLECDFSDERRIHTDWFVI